MSDRIAHLDRWLAHGGTCHLIERGHGASVVLCRCDGGEEVERFDTTDANVIAWVRRNSS